MIIKLFQKIDDILSFLFSNNCNEAKFLKKIFKKKSITVVDIGANNLSYSLFLLKNLNINKLFCIEPQKKLYKKILSKFKFNRKVMIFPYALSNRESERRFYNYSVDSSSGFYQLGSTYRSLNKIKSISKIKTKTFDQIFNKNLKIDICKLDVEGEDYNVLLGMKKNFKNIRLLKLELYVNSMHKSSSGDFLKIINFLKRFNFKLVTISKTKFNNEELLYMDAYFLKKDKL